MQGCNRLWVERHARQIAAIPRKYMAGVPCLLEGKLYGKMWDINSIREREDAATREREEQTQDFTTPWHKIDHHNVAMLKEDERIIIFTFRTSILRSKRSPLNVSLVVTT